MVARVQEIKVWPTPNKMPAKLPYFTEYLRAPSSYCAYFEQIEVSNWQLRTVLMFMIAVITRS